MVLYLSVCVIGLLLLVWSADRFVSGASNVAKHLGLSPLLIGMIIIGFGTSAPEMVVSAISSFQGNPGLAIGNAYGSNITNISLILGVTALMAPIYIKSNVLKKELPILFSITILSIILIQDLYISRIDGLILGMVFVGLMTWSIREGLKNSRDTLSKEVRQELKESAMPFNKSIVVLIVGLILLVASSRMLVYGAVGIAQGLGVSDVIIGLTIVAIGTSLPELASSIIAAKKGEPDMAIGNVIGSNLFNTLAVVSIAGTINPLSIDQVILHRDVTVMTILTALMFIFAYGFKGKGRLARMEGGLLLLGYIIYTSFLIREMI
ncbi:MAG: calcium/sodium antiporter [Bacteriovoracaceae bacterium]